MSFMKTMYASTRNAGRIWTPACMWPAARHPIGLEPLQLQRRQKHCCRVRAAEDNKAAQDNDKSIEMLERRSRRRKSAAAPTKQREPQAPKVSKGRWREGQLFPDGWDEMDPGQKAYQLWAGKRGVLFWANKAAYASVFIVVAGWILFRFVGPALGLYQLSNDFSSAPSP